MHRRRHKVPWKLLKRPDNQDTAVKKKVFICPEPSCLHHHPCHAFGDLVGIKKHFRRNHSDNKQWVFAKCCKGYAVQSDYKARLKTCGTKGHSCDCGRVFFPEWRLSSNTKIFALFDEFKLNSRLKQIQPPLDASFSLSPLLVPESARALELQLLPSSSTHSRRNLDENCSTHLKLSIGSNSNELSTTEANKWNNSEAAMLEEEATRLKELATEQLKLAMAEKAYAEKGR
ncbi:protein BASIC PENTACYSTEINE2-like [Hibiscus syriacus]|uniref:Protein BASIC PENTACYSTEINE2-like n=1 Tax=Hibiscus syriacus TaxID=106335 RepID=A0A6A3CMC8_HIBSY|nr:protein BASIC PENTACYSTEINE2-like [Hibiscus syriacus]